MKKAILLFLFVGITISNFAQKNQESQLGSWYMYNGSHKLSDKYSLKSMAHFRFFDLGDDMQQFIGRIGVNYKLNNTVNFTIGYAYINTDDTFGLDGGNVNEHRSYEDINVKHKLNKLGFAHRFRAEQRFFADRDNGHFIRYQLGVNYPISDKWASYIYDEIFFDFTGEALNQNWLGGGFSYKVSKTSTLKFGYQQISINDGPTLDRLLVGIVLNTDHRKKK